MIPPLFNPSNDMALAAHVRQYFPPRRIQRMEEDLTTLARFWEEGPWGWSLATKARYLRMGVPENELPSDEQIEVIRRLSSREFACGYLRQLLDTLSDDALVGRDMCFCRTVPTFAPCPTIFKSPWSSSGRGIVVAKDGVTPDIVTRLNGFLRTQGGFLSDRFYENKTLDFAMEFWVYGPDSVEFLGFSVFQTDGRGAYGGNIVASQEVLRSLIPIDEALLQSLISYHKSHLATLPYTGPVGIDMMLLADGKVHPVVEINLRLNMGILALLLHRQGVTEDQELTPFREHGFHAVIRDGRLSILFRP